MVPAMSGTTPPLMPAIMLLLPATMVFLNVTDPPLLKMPPASVDATLALKVQLISVRLVYGSLKIAAADLAELPEKVLLIIVRVPIWLGAPSFQIPPPALLYA